MKHNVNAFGFKRLHYNYVTSRKTTNDGLIKSKEISRMITFMENLGGCNELKTMIKVLLTNSR